MIKAIKIEIHRAFYNISYLAALLVGSVITILQFLFRVLPKTGSIGVNLNRDYPFSVFNTCLMFDMGGFYSYFYLYAIILIATIPFGTSYYTDLRNGYIKNICTRMDKRKYLIGKYVAVFISAGSVCVIPLILNLLLTSMTIPALIPQVGTARFAILGNCMLRDLFYTHPWIYVGIYLLIDFVMAGLFACVALVAAKFVYNIYIVLFIPFILFIVIQTVAQFFYFSAAGPYFIMNASQTTWENPVIVIIEIAVLFLFTFVTFYLMGGKKRDTL